MKQRKNGNHRDLDIPEIPRNAKLKPLHRRPATGALLPKDEIKLRVEKHVLTWFRYEAERQKKPIDTFINDALRQFITRHVGEQELRAGGLNPQQRAEVQALIGEMLMTKRKRRGVPV